MRWFAAVAVLLLAIAASCGEADEFQATLSSSPSATNKVSDPFSKPSSTSPQSTAPLNSISAPVSTECQPNPEYLKQYSIDINTGDLRARSFGPEWRWFASKDGSMLARSAGDHLEILPSAASSKEVEERFPDDIRPLAADEGAGMPYPSIGPGHVLWSPDSQLVAFITDAWEVALTELDGNIFWSAGIDDLGMIEWWYWSEDSSHLFLNLGGDWVLGAPYDIYAINAVAPSLGHVVHIDAEETSSISPDGTAILIQTYGHPDSEHLIELLDLRDGALRPVAKGGWASWASGRSETFYVTERNGSEGVVVSEVERTTLQINRESEVAEGRILESYLSPDGRYLAFWRLLKEGSRWADGTGGTPWPGTEFYPWPRLFVIDLVSGRESIVGVLGPARAQVIWSPESSRFAVLYDSSNPFHVLVFGNSGVMTSEQTLWCLWSLETKWEGDSMIFRAHETLSPPSPPCTTVCP